MSEAQFTAAVDLVIIESTKFNLKADDSDDWHIDWIWTISYAK